MTRYYRTMKSNQAKHSPAAAPSACVELSRLINQHSPGSMQAWQVAGFVAGLICGLGPAPEEAFSAEEDPEDMLILDCIDELTRAEEDKDSPIPAETIFETTDGTVIKEKLVTLVTKLEEQLSQTSGQPGLGFAGTAIAAEDPTLADVPAARQYADGLLRGLIMSIEDEEALSDEQYGEVLSLIFILTEEELGPDFGTPAEVAEARQAVAMALPGLVAQLWALSHSEDD